MVGGRRSLYSHLPPPPPPPVADDDGTTAWQQQRQQQQQRLAGLACGEEGGGGDGRSSRYLSFCSSWLSFAVTLLLFVFAVHCRVQMDGLSPSILIDSSPVANIFLYRSVHFCGPAVHLYAQTPYIFSFLCFYSIPSGRGPVHWCFCLFCSFVVHLLPRTYIFLLLLLLPYVFLPCAMPYIFI